MGIFKSISEFFIRKDKLECENKTEINEEEKKEIIYDIPKNNSSSRFFHTFSTHNITTDDQCGFGKSIQRDISEFLMNDGTFDSESTCSSNSFIFNGTFGVPSLLSWYGSQGFIGYQMCAIIASNSWIIDKACTMPARDAVRKGYTISINKDENIQDEVIEEINKLNDQKYHINKNMIEYIRFGRIFGIRIALFEFSGVDDEFYKNPFNLDGVKPNSYKGISQIDPQWITPQLDRRSTTDPTYKDYYEPTYWYIGGRSLTVHKSHLMIMRNSEVPDLLKPSYMFGGVSVPQRIYERVYAAERTANEAPMLAMTKRLLTWSLDQAKAIAAGDSFDRIMEWNAKQRDNFGIQTIGLEDQVMQHETSLSDLDTVIMTQYQLVAAIAGVPATKLLGTQVKGFNTTGEYEESSYHEELESIQECDLIPLLERHHQIVVRSDIMPIFNISSPFDVTVAFTPLDALTEKEQAEINNIKATTASTLIQSGALDPEHERKRIIADETSGYNGIAIEEETEEDEDLNGEFEIYKDIENEKQTDN